MEGRGTSEALERRQLWEEVISQSCPDVFTPHLSAITPFSFFNLLLCPCRFRVVICDLIWLGSFGALVSAAETWDDVLLHLLLSLLFLPTGPLASFYLFFTLIVAISSDSVLFYFWVFGCSNKTADQARACADEMVGQAGRLVGGKADRARGHGAGLPGRAGQSGQGGDRAGQAWQGSRGHMYTPFLTMALTNVSLLSSLVPLSSFLLFFSFLVSRLNSMTRYP